MVCQLAGVQILGLFAHCFAVDVHGWFVGGFVTAPVCGSSRVARPLLLSPCSTDLDSPWSTGLS